MNSLHELAGELDKGTLGLVSSGSDEIESLKDLRKADYFDRVQMRLKKLGSRVSLNELVQRMREFDDNKQGRIQIHHFINILKHNYEALFDNETLIGL